MITIWYRYRGQRPQSSRAIIEDANDAATLPQPFEIVGVTYGRGVDDGTVDRAQLGLVVGQPSDAIPQTAVESIATTFEDTWGGSIEFVESVVRS